MQAKAQAVANHQYSYPKLRVRFFFVDGVFKVYLIGRSANRISAEDLLLSVDIWRKMVVRKYTFTSIKSLRIQPGSDRRRLKPSENSGGYGVGAYVGTGAAMLNTFSKGIGNSTE